MAVIDKPAGGELQYRFVDCAAPTIVLPYGCQRTIGNHVQIGAVEGDGVAVGDDFLYHGGVILS
jgi:hypothetical protein